MNNHAASAAACGKVCRKPHHVKPHGCNRVYTYMQYASEIAESHCAISGNTRDISSAIYSTRCVPRPAAKYEPA